MNHTKQYKNYEVQVTINKRLKHSYISIDKDKNISIKTPYKSEAFIETFLQEKSAWIEKQFLKMDKLIFIQNDELYTRDFLRDRVEYFSQEMGLDFVELKYRKMRSRWGSCSSKRVITLNTQLLKLKKELIDYVVVHELAHLVHMNHSKEFHALVEQYLPNSKALRAELKTLRLL